MKVKTQLDYITQKTNDDGKVRYCFADGRNYYWFKGSKKNHLDEKMISLVKGTTCDLILDVYLINGRYYMTLDRCE